MEAFLEVVLQFLFEIIIQVVVQLACEFGLQSIVEAFKPGEVKNPWLAGFGYILLGAAVGGLSLLAFHSTMIHHSALRLVNLFLTPVVAGLVATTVGRWRRKRGQDLIRLDRFGYGFLFAFAMALVRFLYATRPGS